ncbi:MAG: FAD:protein FMN transferase [Planctomycetota bacterium]
MISQLPRLYFHLLVTSLIVAASTHSSSAADRFAIDGRTMGTTYHIVVASSVNQLPDGQSAGTVQQSVDAALQRIDLQMSTWRDDSELSQFNSSDSTEWFDVSPAVVEVVSAALHIAELSDGAFDPTVGPLVRLWSFGSDQRNRKLPDPEEIASALKHTGWQKIQIRTAPPALRKSDSDVELDLSAIAKGYGVDVVSDLLTELGLLAHLVEIGGEVRTRGLKPDGSAWRTGIQRPDSGLGTLTTAIELNDQALATSGDYRNFFEVDGHRYSHTIDPQTGRPVEHSVASVSVIANTCMTADALATAINVLGPEPGIQLAGQLHAETLILIRSADGFEEQRSAGFPAAIAPPAASPENAPASSPLMQTVLAAGILVGLSLAGMAVGVIFSNRRIQGSCGGLANMPGAEHSPCELCTKPVEECPNKAAIAASVTDPDADSTSATSTTDT